jgi:putative effector of murein hydrolase LrgA (UPF0299 family)
MEEAGSNFSWFMAYLIIGVLLTTGVAAWVMVWQHRKRRRDRRAASKASRAKLRDWRAGK